VNAVAAMDPITIRLDQALQGGALPAEGQSIGERLMAQLNQPTRVAVIGLAGSGKTSLVNMLLGARLMPDLDEPAMVELGYGETARVQIVLPDGTLQTRSGLADPSGIPPGALRIVQDLPDPRLKEWSFLELTLSHAGKDQAAFLDWLPQRTDIAIWCSQVFGDHERSLWSEVPDHLKDHSFLALTRADRMLMKGELAGRIARLQPVVADEFLGLYPVATLQAAAARKAGSVPNDALWQSSGAKAFVEAIQRQVDQARTASLDHAYILLERYKAALADPGRLVGSAPAGTVPVPVPLAQAAPTLAPASQKPDAKAVLRQALGVLQDCAEDLIAAPDGDNGAAADRILQRCAAAADALVQLLSETDAADPDLEVLRDDAIEGEQMLMLLRLERGETAAEDSLTVLLQLKKEMSERVAR
jgi:energy-coupling factor transporter ATP-binding protein EcfA2